MSRLLTALSRPIKTPVALVAMYTLLFAHAAITLAYWDSASNTIRLLFAVVLLILLYLTLSFENLQFYFRSKDTTDN